MGKAEGGGAEGFEAEEGLVEELVFVFLSDSLSVM